MSAGDLSQQIALDAGDSSSVLAALASMQSQLRELVGALATQARAVEQSAAKVTAATDRVAGGSHAQLDCSREMVSNVKLLADSLRDVVSAVGEAKQIVDESTRISVSGATLAGKAAGEIESMAGSVRATAADIHELGTQSASINAIQDAAHHEIVAHHRHTCSGHVIVAVICRSRSTTRVCDVRSDSKLRPCSIIGALSA